MDVYRKFFRAMLKQVHINQVLLVMAIAGDKPKKSIKNNTMMKKERLKNPMKAKVN